METTLFKAVELVGFPGAMLVIIVLTIWRAFRWAQPHLERVVTATILLIDELRITQAKHSAEMAQFTSEILPLIRDTHRYITTQDMVHDLRKNHESI